MKVDIKIIDFPHNYYRIDFQRVDFGRWSSLFDLLIKQHGVYSLIQKNIRCPCVNEIDRPSPYCKECKGKGRKYIDYSQDYLLFYGYGKRWSERSLEVPVYAEEGTVNCNFPSRLQLMLWDRIKPTIARSGIQQVYEINGSEIELDYDPVQLSEIWIWDEDDKSLQRIDVNEVELEEIIDEDGKISQEKKKLKFKKEYKGKITVRYYARPFWYIIELPSEYRGSRIQFMLPGEFWAEYPKVAVLRRADYIQA